MTDTPASFYDVISDPAKRLAHEGDFLLRLLSRAPGRRVLDMAAATGVHAEFLAKNGAFVTARDIDEEALGYARVHRGHPCVLYETGDMRTPSAARFDLAIVMGNSLSMLPSLADVEKTFEAMRAQMSQGACGFAHVINYLLLDQTGPRQKIARRALEDGEIVVVKNMIPAPPAGAAVSFAWFRRSGDVWETRGSQSVLLRVEKEFLERAVRKAGLEVEAEYGDYDFSPFDPLASPDLLVILRTPAG